MRGLYKRIVTMGMISFTAVLAWIYCILEYRNEAVYVAGISLILVISLYALLNAAVSLHIEKENKLHNYISEVINNSIAQLREHDDDSEVERLSKAMYVQLRKTNTILSQMAEANTSQAAQNLEDHDRLTREMTSLITDSINKSVKILIKYNQTDNNNMVSALSDLSAGLADISREIDQLKTSIADIKLEIPDLQQMPVMMSSDTAETYTKTDDIKNDDIKDDEFESNSVSIKDDAFESNNVSVNEDDSMPDLDSFFNEFGGSETKSQDAPSEPTADPIADPNRPLTPDEIAALFAASSEDTNTDTVESKDNMEDIAEKDADDTDAIADVIPFPSKDTETETADDPNRQLSPDEIAALFASASGNSVDATANSDSSDATTDNIDHSDDISDFAAEQSGSPAADTNTAAPADDPNRPLTPEEIAALFASMQ